MDQNVSGKVSKSPSSDFHVVRQVVQLWLLIGVVMVFIQVLIGGVTRLTDSGLSITEWAVIQGTLPPSSTSAWEEAFELYKTHAKRQYENLHGDMTLSDFKVIYFWEYLHRLWARLMGFVFIIPFFIFLMKGWMPRWLVRRLGIVILLAAAAAIFGWIMVASGLNEDNRTWVSAYKLVIHLGIATALFCYLFWTWLRYKQPEGVVMEPKLYKWGWILSALLLLQILFGGLMAGMRAGLIHPHWPFFVEGEQLWRAIGSFGSESSGLVDYETAVGMKGIVQVLHRLTAYILAIAIIWWVIQLNKLNVARIKVGLVMLVTLLIMQIGLGILTILNAIGRIPVGYASAHQAVALLLFASLLYLVYQLKLRSSHSLD